MDVWFMYVVIKKEVLIAQPLLTIFASHLFLMWSLELFAAEILLRVGDWKRFGTNSVFDTI